MTRQTIVNMYTRIELLTAWLQLIHLLPVIALLHPIAPVHKPLILLSLL